MTTVNPKKSGNEPITSNVRDDQAPYHHGRWIVRNHADRCQHRDRRADVAVEQQRERNDADGQH